MAVTQVYRVIWHEEIGGRQVGHVRHLHVQAAANDYNTLKNVIITNQAMSRVPGGVFVIDNVANVGPNDISQ